MSGGGPTRIPSTMMLPPALDDCIATPPALISHDDSDAVGTLLRLERRAERPRTPASYTRADEPGNKPSRRRRPPRPCMLRAVLFGDRSWEDKKGAESHITNHESLIVGTTPLEGLLNRAPSWRLRSAMGVATSRPVTSESRGVRWHQTRRVRRFTWRAPTGYSC